MFDLNDLMFVPPLNLCFDILTRLETSPPAARNVPPPTTSTCMICNNKVYAEQINEHVNDCLDLHTMDGSHSELALYKPQKCMYLIN